MIPAASEAKASPPNSGGQPEKARKPSIVVARTAQLMKILRTPVVTSYQKKIFFIPDKRDHAEHDRPLSHLEKQVFATCAVLLLLLLLLLTCWSAGLLAPGQTSISFAGLAGKMVGQMCQLRPPLSLANVLNHDLEIKKAFDKLVCVSFNLFYMRYGFTDEKPMDVECDQKIEGKDFLALQTIDNFFEPLEICKELLGAATLVCKKGMFDVDGLCDECAKAASGTRLSMIFDRMFDIYHRRWLNPHTTFTSQGIIVPFDTVLLAVLFKEAGRKDLWNTLRIALVFAENIAIQDLSRPWESIEIHAYNLSFKSSNFREGLNLGFMKMTPYQFYWMLRIENYCANRFSTNSRTHSDSAYEIYLGNVLRVLQEYKD